MEWKHIPSWAAEWQYNAQVAEGSLLLPIATQRKNTNVKSCGGHLQNREGPDQIVDTCG